MCEVKKSYSDDASPTEENGRSMSGGASLTEEKEQSKSGGASLADKQSISDDASDLLPGKISLVPSNGASKDFDGKFCCVLKYHDIEFDHFVFVRYRRAWK